jgi:hypothetical protein
VPQILFFVFVEMKAINEILSCDLEDFQPHWIA